LGWFQKLIGSESKAFSDLGIPGLFEYGVQTATNINGLPSLALLCQPFAHAHRIRIETLGTLSLKFYQRGDDTDAEAKDHSLYRLLHDRPNPWTSATQFIMQMESDTILYGDAFALANRVDGKIIELIRLDPSRVVVGYDPVTLEPHYKLSLGDGIERPYAWQDILHVPSANGSAARNAREAIGLSMALERHAAKILSNGARPSGLYKNKKKLSDVAYDRLKRSLSTNFSGENAGAPLLLEEDSDFTPLTFNSVDLQFQEMRIFQTIEIGRALGIPPSLMFEMGRATFANAESMGQSYRTYTILGRCKIWEGAISRLLTEDEQAQFYPEFLTDSLVRADLAARFDAYSKGCGGPWLSVDEIRALDNLPKIAGGDVLRPPANAVGVQADGSGSSVRPKPTAVAA
jgi:HK97 family phage portal protein